MVDKKKHSFLFLKDDIKSLMTHVVENFYPQLEGLTYVRTFRELKLRYDQHKEKLNDPLNRSRLGNDR